MRFKRHLCFLILFVKTSSDGLLVCGAPDWSWCRWNAQQSTRAGHKESNMMALEGHSWESGGSTSSDGLLVCGTPDRRWCRRWNAQQSTRAGHKGSNMWALEGHNWESGGSTLRVAVRLCMHPCRLMNAVVRCHRSNTRVTIDPAMLRRKRAGRRVSWGRPQRGADIGHSNVVTVIMAP